MGVKEEEMNRKWYTLTKGFGRMSTTNILDESEAQKGTMQLRQEIYLFHSTPLLPAIATSHLSEKPHSRHCHH
jgi:hypothetical protein